MLENLGQNVTCHHSITLQLLPKLCIHNITMVVAFFILGQHQFVAYLDCMNYDQGILRICMIVGCCVQRILAALGRSVGKCTNAQLLSSLSSKSNPNSCNGQLCSHMMFALHMLRKVLTMYCYLVSFYNTLFAGAFVQI